MSRFLPINSLEYGSHIRPFPIYRDLELGWGVAASEEPCAGCLGLTTGEVGRHWGFLTALRQS
jgi:hypothetical protein